MKILMASTPATGHLNPLLAVARVLRDEDHEIAVLSGSVFRDRIENSGARFIPLPAGANFDLPEVLAAAPELRDIPRGFEWFRIALQLFFIDAVPAQYRGLLQALEESPQM